MEVLCDETGRCINDVGILEKLISPELLIPVEFIVPLQWPGLARNVGPPPPLVTPPPNSTDDDELPIPELNVLLEVPNIPPRPPPSDDGGDSCRRSASVASIIFCWGCDADEKGAMHSNKEAIMIIWKQTSLQISRSL